MSAVTLIAIVLGSAAAGGITIAFIAGSVLREAEADLATAHHELEAAQVELDRERHAHDSTKQLMLSYRSELLDRRRRRVGVLGISPDAGAPVHQAIREAIAEDEVGR